MVIGVTGGIGTGKSTICKIIESYYGYPVFYADKVGKEIMQSNDYIRRYIRSIDEKLDDNGLIDTKALGLIAFSNPKVLKGLSDMIQPLVQNRLFDWIKENDNCGYIFVENALIFENNKENQYDKIICSYVPDNLQLDRISARDKCSREVATEKIKNQLHQEEKVAKSDYVLMTLNEDYIKTQLNRIIRDIRYEKSFIRR